MARRIGANRRNARIQKRRAIRARIRKHRHSYARAMAVMLLVLSSVAVCALGIYGADRWLRTSQRFIVGAVEVRGSQRVPEHEIVKMAGVSAGMRMIDVRPSRVRQVLQASPWIEKVRVRRWLGGRVVVNVTERTPVALVNLGKVYQVDQRGVLFDIPQGMYLELPVVSGLSHTVDDKGLRCLDDESLRRLLSFRRSVARDDPTWFQYLSQIDFSGEHRVRLALEGYPAAVYVESRDISRKMDQLRRLLEVLADRGSIDAKVINLCHNNVAYVRP